MYKSDTTNDVVLGFGGALVDMLLPVSEAELASLPNVAKGDVRQIEAAEFRALLERFKGPEDIEPWVDCCRQGLVLDDETVDSVMSDTLIDPRSALEPFLGPILNELDLSRAYLSGKHGMSIGRVMLVGLPAGGRHVAALAHDAFKMDVFQPGVFDGLQQPPKGEIAGDCAFLPALGAALAASEVQW